MNFATGRPCRHGHGKGPDVSRPVPMVLCEWCAYTVCLRCFATAVQERRRSQSRTARRSTKRDRETEPLPSGNTLDTEGRGPEVSVELFQLTPPADNTAVTATLMAASDAAAVASSIAGPRPECPDPAEVRAARKAEAAARMEVEEASVYDKKKPEDDEEEDEDEDEDHGDEEEVAEGEDNDAFGVSAPLSPPQPRSAPLSQRVVSTPVRAGAMVSIAEPEGTPVPLPAGTPVPQRTAPSVTAEAADLLAQAYNGTCYVCAKGGLTRETMPCFKWTCEGPNGASWRGKKATKNGTSNAGWNEIAAVKHATIQGARNKRKTAQPYFKAVFIGTERLVPAQAPATAPPSLHQTPASGADSDVEVIPTQRTVGTVAGVRDHVTGLVWRHDPHDDTHFASRGPACVEGGRFRFSCENWAFHEKLAWFGVTEDSTNERPSLPLTSTSVPLSVWTCPPTLQGLAPAPFSMVVPLFDRHRSERRFSRLELYAVRDLDAAVSHAAVHTQSGGGMVRGVRPQPPRPLLTVAVLFNLDPAPPRAPLSLSPSRSPVSHFIASPDGVGVEAAAWPIPPPLEALQDSPAPPPGQSDTPQRPPVATLAPAAAQDLLELVTVGRNVIVSGVGSKKAVLRAIGSSAALRRAALHEIDFLALFPPAGVFATTAARRSRAALAQLTADCVEYASAHAADLTESVAAGEHLGRSFLEAEQADPAEVSAEVGSQAAARAADSMQQRLDRSATRRRPDTPSRLRAEAPADISVLDLCDMSAAVPLSLDPRCMHAPGLAQRYAALLQPPARRRVANVVWAAQENVDGAAIPQAPARATWLRQVVLAHSIDRADAEALAALASLFTSVRGVTIVASFDDPLWPLEAAPQPLQLLSFAHAQVPTMLPYTMDWRAVPDSYAKIAAPLAGILRHDAAAHAVRVPAKSGLPKLDVVTRALKSVPAAFRSTLRLVIEHQEHVGEGTPMGLHQLLDHCARRNSYLTTARLRIFVRELTSNKIAVYDAAHNSVVLRQPRILSDVLDVIDQQLGPLLAEAR